MQPLIEVAPTPTRAAGRPGRALHRTAFRSRRLLRVDGAFLILAGVGQLVSEVLSHYASKGLHDDTFAHSPYTIGFVEAHGLAVMIGAMLLWAANQPRRRFFHGFAIVAHVFLGAANVIFWDSFVEFGFVMGGLLATAAHVMLIAFQAACFVSLTRTSGTSPSAATDLTPVRSGAGPGSQWPGA